MFNLVNIFGVDSGKTNKYEGGDINEKNAHIMI